MTDQTYAGAQPYCMNAMFDGLVDSRLTVKDMDQLEGIRSMQLKKSKSLF